MHQNIMPNTPGLFTVSSPVTPRAISPGKKYAYHIYLHVSRHVECTQLRLQVAEMIIESTA